MRVLLVDDHKMVRQSIAGFISSLDELEIIGEASNGAEAVELARTLSPDLIIMDINMPELDGVEASHRIREFDSVVKILILTMMENEHFILDALSAKINGYIYKMGDLDDLLYAIKSISGGDDYFDPKVTDIIKKSHLKSRNELGSLSTREIEVLKLIVNGLTAKQIGEKLFISHFTAQKHRKNILKKLNVTGTAELVKTALELGIV